MTKENERAFLIELEALTRKYALRVGCKGWGEPCLVDISEKDLNREAGYCIISTDCFEWFSPETSDIDTWEDYKEFLVKGEVEV